MLEQLLKLTRSISSRKAPGRRVAITGQLSVEDLKVWELVRIVSARETIDRKIVINGLNVSSRDIIDGKDTKKCKFYKNDYHKSCCNCTLLVEKLMVMDRNFARTEKNR